MTADDIMARRTAVVAEALTWRGTPYHNHARLKGVGVDCLTFLAGVFEHAGVVDRIELPPYAAQWHLHRFEELYVEGLKRYCVEALPPLERRPLPADIVLWRFGRTFSHGAIVIAWPEVIHAFTGRGVSRANALRDAPLVKVAEQGPERGTPRPMRVFVLEEWMER